MKQMPVSTKIGKLAAIWYSEQAKRCESHLVGGHLAEQLRQELVHRQGDPLGQDVMIIAAIRLGRPWVEPVAGGALVGCTEGQQASRH